MDQRLKWLLPFVLVCSVPQKLSKSCAHSQSPWAMHYKHACIFISCFRKGLRVLHGKVQLGGEQVDSILA